MRLHIGNLTTDTTSEQLMDAARPFGAVTSEIVSDRGSGTSRGYGFIVFKNEVDAATAVAGLRGLELNGQPIRLG
jgi:RNA recognition motif-containing protein